ncbi:hypothetical protein F4778DRAFT_484014 [Xylariomycetidae sp. FL2044]|nr:hypothetical protein F4778DRAFT_484014 [Xylariomycetidae sp. FL2044]
MRHHQEAGMLGLVVSLAGRAAVAGPVMKAQARQEAPTCQELSTTTPNWHITDAQTSDWPGGSSGYLNFFANHVPTGETAACDVEYQLNATDGSIINYDASVAHECLNFGTQALNTSVQLDMDTLVVSLRSTWTCKGDDEEEGMMYTATGSGSLQRNTEPGACLVQESQLGYATTCPIIDIDVEGTLAK